MDWSVPLLRSLAPTYSRPTSSWMSLLSNFHGILRSLLQFSLTSIRQQTFLSYKATCNHTHKPLTTKNGLAARMASHPGILGIDNSVLGISNDELLLSRSLRNGQHHIQETAHTHHCMHGRNAGKVVAALSLATIILSSRQPPLVCVDTPELRFVLRLDACSI